MQAGVARENITPPVGTRMLGFARRDRSGPCTGVHDELFVRALYMAHGNKEVLIASLDLCLIGRPDADRLKAAVGETLGLAREDILLSTTHTHVSPSVGTACYSGYLPPEQQYLAQLQEAPLGAARRATDAATHVTVRAGKGRTALPMSRRRPRPDGSISFAPNPGGIVCDSLPVVLFADADRRPVALLFSASCHPSSVSGHEISAEYPGAACTALDRELGAEVSLFLQGAGGDAKPALSAGPDGKWTSGDWNVVDEVGQTLAREVLGVVENDLSEFEPALCAALVEVQLKLAAPPSRDELLSLAQDYRSDRSPLEQDLRVLWARRQLEQLDRQGSLPQSAPILVQGIQLGEGLRIIAVEGEAVGELGLHIERSFGDGLTIPLGYANGQGLYLPVTHMLSEGGYEVESYFEYLWPAPVAEGAEALIDRAVSLLRNQGIS